MLSCPLRIVIICNYDSRHDHLNGSECALEQAPYLSHILQRLCAKGRKLHLESCGSLNRLRVVSNVIRSLFNGVAALESYVVLEPQRWQSTRKPDVERAPRPPILRRSSASLNAWMVAGVPGPGRACCLLKCKLSAVAKEPRHDM